MAKLLAFLLLLVVACDSSTNDQASTPQGTEGALRVPAPQLALTVAELAALDTVRGTLGDTLLFAFNRTVAGCADNQLRVSGTVVGSRVGCWTAAAPPPDEPPLPPPPPPPPPPATDSVLFTERFETTNVASRGWYDMYGAVTLATQPAVPGGSGTQAIAARFTAGATHAQSWRGMRHTFTPTSTVYLSYWVKYSTNWVGSGRPYGPHEFSLLTSADADYASPAFNRLTAYVEHTYQNGGKPVLALQDGANIDQTRINVDLRNVSENRATVGCNDGIAANCYLSSPGVYNNGRTLTTSQVAFRPTAGAGYKGDWHRVEAQFTLNTIVNGKGIANGIMRYWFDGNLVLEDLSVLFRTGAHPTMQFSQVLFLPYMGEGSPVEQTAWYDDLQIRTTKGSMPSGPPPPAAVATVSVSPGSASVLVGQTSQYTATSHDAAGNALTGRTVTWTSGIASVATVTGSGLATGTGDGQATLTATSEGKSGQAQLTVTSPPAAVATVSVSPATAGVTVGQTSQFSATLRDAGGNTLTGRAVTWTSNNTVATVNGSGLATSLAAGVATIVATAEGKGGQAQLTATPPPPPPPPPTAFATPDVLNNLSFESGWDGMHNWGFTNPSGVSRDCTRALLGSCSVKRTLAVTNGSDVGGQFVYGFYHRPPVKTYDRLWARWSFYLDKAVDGTFKFNIWQGSGFGAQFGGVYFFNGQLSWWFAEYGQITGSVRIASLASLVGGWHSIEVEYWRNGHASGQPAVQLWLDGNAVTGVSIPSMSRWSGNYIVAGGRDSNAKLGTFNLLGVLNGNPRNTVAGNIWVDRISLSSVGRIGP